MGAVDKRVVAIVIIVGAILVLVPVLPKLMKGAGNPELDAQNEQRIQQAIAAYQQSTRVNPPSLDALVPTYLDAVPRPSRVSSPRPSPHRCR